MKAVTLIFIVPNEDEPDLGREIRHSSLISEYPLWVWSTEDADDDQINWWKYQQEENE